MPSRIVTNWLAAIFLYCSRTPLGQKTSTSASAAGTQPEVKPGIIARVVTGLTEDCLRLDFCPVVRHHPRADRAAVRLHALQLDLEPVLAGLRSFRSSEGGSFIFTISTSMSPSLSKSPKAQPRLLWGS